MRILGIDPGYGITGFGVIEAERNQFQLLRCGAITTPAGMDFSARLEITVRKVGKAKKHTLKLNVNFLKLSIDFL